jgi:hypothetical protein
MESFKNAPISFAMSACLSALRIPVCNNLRTAEQMFMKFCVGKFN